VLGRKRNDQFAMKHRQRAPRHDQAAVRPARDRDGALDLAGRSRECCGARWSLRERIVVVIAERDIARQRLNSDRDLSAGLLPW
jgi:hypothetical protein